MPRWIDHQAGKAERQRRAKAEHDAAVARRSRDLTEIKAFRAEQAEEAKARVRPQVRRGIVIGDRRLPDFSDEELRQALGRAHRTTPRHLDYPHLLIFRERGWTRTVYADDGTGEFGVPKFRGDVLTEVGEQWLRQT